MSVVVERRERILIVKLDREPKRNALDASITAGLDAAMNQLEDDPACNLVDQAGLPAAPFRARVDAGGTP